MDVCLTILGVLILIGNFLVGTGSTSPVSETDVIRHIDYLIGFLLIAAGAIINAIEAGTKDSQQERRRLADIDVMRKNITMPSPPVLATKQEIPTAEEPKNIAMPRPSPIPGQDPKKKSPMTSKDIKIGVIITVVCAIVFLVFLFLAWAGLLAL